MMKIAACGPSLAAHLNPSQSESIRRGFGHSKCRALCPCGTAGPYPGLEPHGELREAPRLEVLWLWHKAGASPVI